MVWPSLLGAMPRFEATIDFSIALTMPLSHGLIASWVGSGTVIAAH